MEYKAELFLKNVNNLSDARFAASEGFFAISYNLSPSSDNYLESSKVKELNEWVSGPLKIAQFDETIPDLVNDALIQTGLELAMLPFSSKAEDLKKINNPIILALASDDLKNLDSSKLKLAEYLFIDLKDQSIKVGDQRKALLQLIKNYLVFLSVGNQYNKSEVVEELNPFGLVLKGGKEYKPGIKNYERLNAEVEEMKY